MTLNPDDEQFKNTGRRKYLFNKDNYSSFDVSREDKIKELAKCKRRKRDSFLQKNYDWNKSVSDNAKLLDLSKSTIYNFLNENSHKLNSEIKYSEFLELYNKHPEIRSVRKLAQLTGLSDKTVQKYKKRIEGSNHLQQ
jgi:DNA invertase Pin-like site-specific DNA recombinase